MDPTTSGDILLRDLGDDNADLTSHDAFVRAVPHATFARLRREDPVAWIDETHGSGFWAVTRYQDIVEVSRDWKTFTVTKGIRLDRKSTRLNSSHVKTSYAVFCLKKKYIRTM